MYINEVSVKMKAAPFFKDKSVMRGILHKKWMLLGIALSWFLMASSAVAQQEFCDFWGTATVLGVPVDGDETIKAFDSNNMYLATAYQVGSGLYSIHVPGDDPTTPEKDGAYTGESIRFKIDGQAARVVSGSNSWIKGSRECNIEIPQEPPQANAGGPYSGPEGGTVNFNGSGSLYASTYDWNFGDGTPHGSGVAPTHVYVDDANYSVSLTVTNSMGSDADYTTANIYNVAPSVQAGNNKTSNEGDVLNFSGSATDPGVLDVLSYSWNFGDGGTASGQTASHAFLNDGVFNVVLSVSDGDGGVGTDNLTATVNNIPPTVEAGSNKNVNEGATVNFSGSATDPGVLDVLTYNWNFGDGGAGTGKNTTYAYGDNGTFTVTLTVNDGTDNGTDNLTVQVSNVAPTANAGGPYTGVVNNPVQFNGSATDPGFNDILTFDWDLDGDGNYEVTNNRNPTKTYTSTGTRTVRLRVRDDDGGENISTTTVEVNEGVQVTFRTAPIGMQVIVGGQYYKTPATIILIPGRTYTIEAPFTQWQGEGYRYVFSYWNDGGAREHNIVAPSYQVTYTAQYQLQYFLDIDTGGKGGNPVGEGWYDPGARVQISIDSAVVAPEGDSRYSFQRWVGTGNGSYTGESRQVTVTVNEHIIQAVEWAEEYRLEIQSAYGEFAGDGWYEPGTEVTISVDSSASTGKGRRYFFQYWEGEGEGSYTGTDNPAVVTMDSPILEVAVWQAQYYIEVISEYGEPYGEGWYDSGDTATVSIDTVVNAGEGTRVRFLRWEGVGLGSYTGVMESFEIVVQGPITETARWGTQYYLKLSSDWGNPVGEGWYEDGSLATFSIDSMVNAGQGKRYRFTGWTGTGTGSYTGDDLNPSVVMQGPIEEVAEWEYQYYISIQVNPIDGGEVFPIAVPGDWAKAESTIELTAVGNAEQAYGFSHWSGDAEGSDNPLSLFVDAPKALVAHFSMGRVIVASEPSGLKLAVDGKEVVSPVVYNWLAGETHRIRAISPQGDNVTTKYVFSEWSDGGAQEHDISVTEDLVVYTAMYDASYYLKVDSKYGTPVGEGWYIKGAQVPVTIDSVVQETEGILRKFARWNGTGNGSVTTTNRNILVTMNGPIVQRAQWDPQFRLHVRTYPPVIVGVDITVDPAGPWYDPGTEVTLHVTVTDTTASFTGWTGSVSDTANPLTVVVNNPMEIVANFDTPNQPPQIQGMPDVSVMEDATLILSFAWLGQYVTDPNDPPEWLDWDFTGGTHLTFRVDDNRGEVRITPEANWNGVEEITIEVTDPVGMSASDIFQVRVIGLPDPPGHFQLISPPRDTTIQEWTTPMLIEWETSDNVDTGDEIVYSFYFSPYPNLTGLGTIQMSAIADTQILLMPQPDGVYYWGVRAEDKQGYETWCDSVYIIDIDTDIPSENPIVIPTDYGLSQNYPNPFNPQTTLQYRLPKTGRVRLSVFDIRGAVVRILVDEVVGAGHYVAVWDGRDDRNTPVASGIYFVRIEAGEFVQHKKMILMR